MLDKFKNNLQAACLICFVLIALLSSSACAYRPKIVIACIPKTKQCTFVKEPTSLPAKEKLMYSVSWLGIPSGRLIIETKGIEKINNRDYYHVTANAGPNSFFSLFFNIKYFVETYIDKDTGLPLKFYKKKSYKGKITEEKIYFDYDNNIATCEYTGDPKKTVKFDKNIQDLLSFLYYFRLKGFESKQTYNFDIVQDGKAWPIKMIVDDVHLVKLRNGDCIDVVSVKLSSPLISKVMGAEVLEAYVSADKRRIPIFFTTKTKMGEADTNLANLECLK